MMAKTKVNMDGGNKMKYVWLCEDCDQRFISDQDDHRWCELCGHDKVNCVAELDED
jgi:rRNA maturation endonuclease Nob1